MAIQIFTGLVGLSALAGAAWIVLCIRRSNKKQQHHIFIQQDTWS